MPSLPVTPYPVNTPREMEEGDYWFDDRDQIESDLRLMDAVLTRGFGRRRSPIGYNWVCFCIVGALHGTIRGSLIDAPWGMSPNPNDDLFTILWNLLYDKPKELDPAFSATLLRVFIPGHRSHGRSHFYDRCFFDSPLEGVWFGYLTPTTRKSGLKVFPTLPPATQDSILMVAKHMPAMIRIASKELNKNGHW